jgi:hypothetical protein
MTCELLHSDEYVRLAMQGYGARDLDVVAREAQKLYLSGCSSYDVASILKLDVVCVRRLLGLVAPDDPAVRTQIATSILKQRRAPQRLTQPRSQSTRHSGTPAMRSAERAGQARYPTVVKQPRKPTRLMQKAQRSVYRQVGVEVTAESDSRRTDQQRYALDTLPQSAEDQRSKVDPSSSGGERS